MKKSLTTAGALLALAALATNAQAGMGGITMPTSMSRGDTRISTNSSLGSVRTFSPDGQSIGANRIEARGASHWKKPIDSDQGGDSDPPKKTPKDSQTSDNGGGVRYPYHPYTGPGGWYGHHPHPHSDGDRGNSGNVPQRDCRGC